ncbi:MAG TPA: M28 family peptidase [Polyangiaceae bacterium]|nr:M28 family peptidase [Polyangiaceae bacterium]
MHAEPPRSASTPPSAERPTQGERPALLGLRWLCIAVLALWAAWLVVRLGPPDAVPATAPPAEFSAARARVHLERIARVPHPSGSAAARDVEAYLTAELRSLGLDVELRAGPACNETAGLRRCGHVRNVIGTWRGRAPDGALLLSAHYDSVANAPGAGDDGAAVAALLEVARGVSQAGPLEHDVIFALLDGEEDLLLGSNQLCWASRLVSAAPLAARVRLVANFDARGSRGAVTLISATEGSARAISALSSELKHPVLSSFYPSVARALPNATDAEVYERCGFETLSFAFAAGFENYHQGTDTAANLDDRSLQHHGEHALAIVRRFAAGALDVREPGAGGLVFFDVGALFVVRYPYWVARVLAAALGAATLVFVRRQVRTGVLSLRAALAAPAAFVLTTLGALSLGALVVPVITIGWSPWQTYLHAPGLAACAASLVLAAIVPLAAWVRRRCSAELPALGPLLVGVALTLVTAVALPGTSQLFTWPAAALLLSLGIGSRLAGAAGIVAHALLLVPAVLMLTPVVYTLLVVLGAPGVAGAMVCLVALLGTGVDPLALLARRPRIVAALGAGLAALGAVALALHVRNDPAPPTPNAVAYALDADAQRAVWLSLDGSADAYERQFLGASPELGSVPALGSDRRVLMNTAPPIELAPPTLELVSDRWTEGERTLELRVRSPRGARSVVLWADTSARFSSYRFDGADPLGIVRFSPELDEKLLRLLTGMGDRQRWSITLFAPLPEGSRLTLVTRHAGPLQFQCADRSEGLAVLPDGFAPRSAEWTEGYPGDQTLVSSVPLEVGALAPPPP